MSNNQTSNTSTFRRPEALAAAIDLAGAYFCFVLLSPVERDATEIKGEIERLRRRNQIEPTAQDLGALLDLLVGGLHYGEVRARLNIHRKAGKHLSLPVKHADCCEWMMTKSYASWEHSLVSYGISLLENRGYLEIVEKANEHIEQEWSEKERTEDRVDEGLRPQPLESGDSEYEALAVEAHSVADPLDAVPTDKMAKVVAALRFCAALLDVHIADQKVLRDMELGNWEQFKAAAGAPEDDTDVSADEIAEAERAKDLAVKDLFTLTAAERALRLTALEFEARLGGADGGFGAGNSSELDAQTEEAIRHWHDAVIDLAGALVTCAGETELGAEIWSARF